jgi:hypothetical protein
VRTQKEIVIRGVELSAAKNRGLDASMRFKWRFGSAERERSDEQLAAQGPKLAVAPIAASRPSLPLPSASTDFRNPPI